MTTVLSARSVDDRLNAAVWLLDRRVAAGDGDRVAVRCAGRDHTYADVAALSSRVAAALRHGGTRPEERVVLCMADSVELVAAFCGAMRAGCVPIPVSTMATGADLAFMARDARAGLAVVSAEFGGAASVMAAESPELRTLVVCGGVREVVAPGRVRTLGWDDWLAEGDGARSDADDTHRDAPAFWLYTSGTTGRPKGAIHRHADIPCTAETYAAQVLGIRPDDRCHSVAKLFFAYGLGNSLSFPFSVGATSILDPRRPTPATVAEVVSTERPTLFFATPSFFAGLLATDLDAGTFASVRLAVSAGEALPDPVLRRFRDRFGVDILDGIGSTEALHIFISNRPDDIVPGASGRSVPGYDAQLVDDDGLPVGEGVPGHLQVRGDSIASGYWCRTEMTRHTFRGEWLRTGDMYTRDTAGVYRYCGRSDDMFKAGGIWVSPLEVESALLEHPDVVEAAVIGEPDADGLHRPAAFLVVRGGAVPDGPALTAFCRERLAAYKVPRRIEFLDALPRTATGKVQRYLLRSL